MKFDSWNTKSDGSGTTYQPGAEFSVDENTILYAQWKPIIYTITYDANGGSGTMENTTGTSVTVASNQFTSPTSHVFKEWNTNSDGTGTTYEVGSTLTENIVLYAIWQYNSCCFDAGSQVLMAYGTTKNIENVSVGDSVITKNDQTGEFEPKKVLRTIIKHNSDDLVYINLSNGTRIGMRAYHPLLTNNGWKFLRPKDVQTFTDIGQNVEMLKVGDTLIGINDNPTIVSIEQRPDIENYDTYNLSVDGNHNYIVEGIVVHNSGVPKPAVEKPTLSTDPTCNAR